MRLEGKVAVITGAGRGLGRAGARLFAKEGARVVVADIDPDSTKRTAGEIEAAGGEAIGIPTDVAEESQVEALIAAACDRFGKLDVIWNNAGIALQGAPATPFEEHPSEVWHRQLAVNLTSVYYGCKHAVAPMRAGGGGSIINTSSAGGVATAKGWGIYSSSKGAVNALTRTLAVELGPYNIRVNALAPTGGMGPGFLRGPGGRLLDEDEWEAERAQQWIPGALGHIPLAMPRPPQLRDHAYLALYMASDESMYMSGQIVVMDGARMAQMPPYQSPVPPPGGR
jgi:NAD(P)-dependent dehydrogenase (short-subunit alcohol dehydrogenase family)